MSDPTAPGAATQAVPMKTAEQHNVELLGQVEITSNPPNPGQQEKVSHLKNAMLERRGNRRIGERLGILNDVGQLVQIEDIDRVLEKHKGNRKQTAMELHLSGQRLNRVVNENAMLKAKWRKWSMVRPGVSQSPNAINALSRDQLVRADPTVPQVLRSEAELAAIIEQEDAKLGGGLGAIGCTPEEVQLGVELKSFHGRHFTKTVDIMTAGLILNSLKLLSVIRHTEERIKSDNLRCSEDGKPVEEMMLRGSYHELHEQYQRYTDLALKGSLIAAKIRALERQAANGSAQTRSKPGFRPKGDVNVIAQNVTLKP